MALKAERREADISFVKSTFLLFNEIPTEQLLQQPLYADKVLGKITSDGLKELLVK